MASKLIPLADKLVLRPIVQEEVLSSGIVIPDTAKEKPNQGEVIAVGPGRRDDDGKHRPHGRRRRRPRPLRQVHRPGDQGRERGAHRPRARRDILCKVEV